MIKEKTVSYVVVDIKHLVEHFELLLTKLQKILINQENSTSSFLQLTNF